jgi:hypothetical protein
MAEAAIDRNLLSTIPTCQALKEMMARHQGGIAIDSVAAFRTCCLRAVRLGAC